ncbi:MAG: hypothetical protein AAFV71_32215, partial [Cyanobacteria bacterium J06633_8]
LLPELPPPKLPVLSELRLLVLETLSGSSKPANRKRPAEEQLGRYQDRYKERKRVKNESDFEITGNTHESEHVIAYSSLKGDQGPKRNSDKPAKNLENKAPAYYEAKDFHRQHIGTGNNPEGGKGKTRDGFKSSDEYWESQRNALEAGDTGTAVQLNQLGYAHNSDFQKDPQRTKKENQVADSSYNTMIENMDSVTYAANATENQTRHVTPKEKAEMYLARRTSTSGKYSTIEEEEEAKNKFGVNDEE